MCSFSIYHSKYDLLDLAGIFSLFIDNVLTLDAGTPV